MPIYNEIRIRGQRWSLVEEVLAGLALVVFFGLLMLSLGLS